MKKLILIFIGMMVLNSSILPQNNIDKILLEIEKNNTALSALDKILEAKRIGNKTDIFLRNPEVEFNYLWGNPAEIGNRVNFAIKQTFDFPSVYVYKNQISNLMNEQTKLEYLKQLKAVQLETKLVCADLVYLNSLKVEVAKRLHFANKIAESYDTKFNLGETTILEFNKAKLNLLNTRKEMETLEINRNSLLIGLATLNGGHFINFVDTLISTPRIIEDFETWYQLVEKKNPTLNWLRKEIKINEKQVSLSWALGLPKFQLGYINETEDNQKMNGFSFGLSIPLWENNNKIKFAEANHKAIEEINKDSKLQFYQNLKMLHSKVFELQVNIADYHSELLLLDNSTLLKKALDSGEISLINYILELSFYYESMNQFLELKREVNKAFAELNQYL